MLGAVILAGGHGRRMGGADKASLFVHGTRFIDRLLAQLPYGTPTVAVSPHRLGVPQVCESPLYGGPVAGIAAGAQALSHCSELALFAVDAPDSPLLLPRLRSSPPPRPMPYSPAPPTATSSRCVPSGALPRSKLSSIPFLRLGTSPSVASSMAPTSSRFPAPAPNATTTPVRSCASFLRSLPTPPFALTGSR